MLYVVTGGSGSGKSAYAEKKLCELWEKAGRGKKIYVATMIPRGTEAARKIEKHKKMRREKEFYTEECYTDLYSFVQERIAGMNPPPLVLLECISNLVANEMYEEGGAGEETIRQVMEGISLLERACRDVVIVTNEVCSEAVRDTEETARYKQVLSEINCWLAANAYEFTEVVCGMPANVVSAKNRPYRRRNTRSGAGIHLVIGGAWQGKQAYVRRMYPSLSWTDGAFCDLDDPGVIEGMFHLEKYIRRWMEKKEKNGAKSAVQRVAELAQENPSAVFVCDELGCGLIPVKAIDRAYREETGRSCMVLASRAVRVDRVVCGIGTVIKGGGGNEN